VDDIVDHPLDAQVGEPVSPISRVPQLRLKLPIPPERTRARPIPSGRVSIPAAFVVLLVGWIAALALFRNYNFLAYACLFTLRLIYRTN